MEDAKKRILSKFFTNTDDNVFCLINLPEVIKGTLFSRYSRSSKDLRTLFLDEFLTNPDLKKIIKTEGEGQDQFLNIQKAEDFYERILVGYGDDSVAELGGAHIAIENISMLATKSIEEHRIGLSPLEKSTRYVYFDKKYNGEYLFYKDKNIMRSKYKGEFLKVTNHLFDTYSKIVREIQPVLKKIFPGDENEKAYKFSIRAKACDLARGLLPLSTLTNMGLFGNGRAFEYLLANLFADPLEEVRTIALKMNENLRKVIPAFIKRATNEKGELYREYLKEREKRTSELLKKLKNNSSVEKADSSRVEILEWDDEGEEKVIAAILYERSQKSFKECLKIAKGLSQKEREDILKAFLEERRNRHHKPGRPLEQIYFAFEITADWGVYKDLMRHRILTRFRQLFTNELGYWMPEEIKLAGFEKLYRNAADSAMELYQKMKDEMPFEAQYVVIHAAYNRFYIKMNLREAVHLTELRSSPQGHPTYRKVAQEIAKRIIEKYPTLGKLALKFVDYNDYHLERLQAFRRLEKKAKKLGVEGFVE